MKLKFVQGKDLTIDLSIIPYALDQLDCKVHDKWLSYTGSHDSTFCKEQNPDDKRPFCCDHAVL